MRDPPSSIVPHRLPAQRLRHALNIHPKELLHRLPLGIAQRLPSSVRRLLNARRLPSVTAAQCHQLNALRRVLAARLPVLVVRLRVPAPGRAAHRPAAIARVDRRARVDRDVPERALLRVRSAPRNDATLPSKRSQQGQSRFHPRLT